MATIEAHWPAEKVGPLTWIKAIRVHQWLKNLLVFVPLFAAHLFLDPAAISNAVLAFLAFGLSASGVYVVNDLLDLQNDRRRPRKPRRPFCIRPPAGVAGNGRRTAARLDGIRVRLGGLPASCALLAVY